MTSRDRVLSAIKRKTIDRIPLDMWARSEVWGSLEKHFKFASREEVQKELGLDIENLFITFEDPSFASRVQSRIPGVSTVSGFLAVDNGDGTYTDQWNVRYGLDPSLSVDHIVESPFADAMIPKDYPWPSLDGTENTASLKQRIQILHEKDFCVFGHILNPFKQAWQLRGFDDFLIDLYLNPEFVDRLFQQLTGYSLWMAENLIAAGADVICIVGDVAMQDRMFFDPSIFSQLLTPIYRWIIDESRKVGAVPFFFHSDGDIMPIMDDLVKAGFSVVNPIQPESMDPLEAKRLYGDILTLHGLISVQTLLPKGSVAEVRETVRNYIDTCGRDGGLILSTTNDAMEDIPLENLLAFYEEAREYSAGLYSSPESSTPRR